jgi:hypothetical protein
MHYEGYLVRPHFRSSNVPDTFSFLFFRHSDLQRMPSRGENGDEVEQRQQKDTRESNDSTQMKVELVSDF